MKKQKKIRKKIKKIYAKNVKQFSLTERLQFKLLIATMGKRRRIVIISVVLKALKWLVGLFYSLSRPGSFSHTTY